MAEDKSRQFDRLIAPHMERLFRAACRLLGNTADAQDLVQDTCVTACENLTDLQASAHPLRWLLRVQHNRFIDGARRRKRAPVVLLDVARGTAMPSDRPGPDELLQQDEEESALERAFLGLEQSQKTLLILRAEGYGLDEIEAITGIGREVLRARLHRARRTLAQRIDEQATGAPSRAPRKGSGT